MAAREVLTWFAQAFRNPTLVLGTDGTSTYPVKVDSNGTVAVQGVASGTAVVVGGPAADDTAASGNPVSVGGIYNTTLPTYTAGDRTQFQFSSRGILLTGLANAAGAQAGIVSAPTDGYAGGGITSLQTMSVPMNYNGTTWDVGRGVKNATDSPGTGIAAAGLVAQVDEVSPTAITENQFGNVRMSPARAIYTEQAGRSFSHITAAAPTTTTPKSAAGFLHTLTINTSAANGVITIYDNTAASGTVIAIITQPAALLSSGPVTVTYDVAFATGLTIVTSGAAQDITVSYR